MTTATEPKKFQIEYQITNDNGDPVGPLQHFEADTQKELLDLVAAAHKNSAKKMYDTMKKVKVGDLITPDPERPIQRFERKPLSADDRTRLIAATKDPQTGPEAFKQLLEAEFGVPFDAIRESLQYVEIDRRIKEAQNQTDLFLNAHPEYVSTDSNQELILKWLEKRNYAITRKNLELAYEDLTGANMLTIQASSPAPKPTPQVSAVATSTEPVIPAPPQPETIPPVATTAPAITETPAEVRPKISSSGLGRTDGSATPSTTPPKVAGITPQQINRMSSTEFDERLKDPAFRKMVDEMKR